VESIPNAEVKEPGSSSQIIRDQPISPVVFINPSSCSQEIGLANDVSHPFVTEISALPEVKPVTQ
jgi:hypothetical protein